MTNSTTTVRDLTSKEESSPSVQEVNLHKRGTDAFSKIEEQHGPFLHDVAIVVGTAPNMPSSLYIARSAWPNKKAQHVAEIF
jgi:hypothetical protein